MSSLVLHYSSEFKWNKTDFINFSSTKLKNLKIVCLKSCCPDSGLQYHFHNFWSSQNPRHRVGAPKIFLFVHSLDYQESTCQVSGQTNDFEIFDFPPFA